MGSEGPQWGPVQLICLSARSSASPFGHHSRDPLLRAAHASIGHKSKFPEWQHNMSVRSSARSSAVLFDIFVFVLISSLGVQHVAMHLLVFIAPFQTDFCRFCASFKIFHAKISDF